MRVTKDKTFLENCMPWSEVYRAYEKKEIEKTMHFFTDQIPPVRPRAPRKKDKIAS